VGAITYFLSPFPFSPAFAPFVVVVVMSLPSPRGVSPSVYSQPHASERSDISSFKPEPVKSLFVRKGLVRDVRYDFGCVTPAFKNPFRYKRYDFGPETPAITNNSSEPLRDRHFTLDLDNPTSDGSSLTQSVQSHLHSPSQSLSSKRSSASTAWKVMNMEQSLTSTPSSSQEPEERSSPLARLEHSPSTPFFPQHHPLRTTASPSTPDLRSGLNHKKGILGRFKGGVKGFFRRERKESPVEFVISAPYGMYREVDCGGSNANVRQAFQHNTTIMNEQDQLVAGPRYEHSIADKMQNLSVSSTAVGQSQSPSPPPIEQFDGEGDSKYDNSISAPNNSVAENHSPPTSQLDSASHTSDPSLTPAEREARRLGLELDFSDVHRLNSSSSASDTVVRQYTDVPSSFYASRLANPVYSGASISNSKAHLPAPQPIGHWRCCKCNHQKDLYHHDKGEHLVSILLCICPHRSCENCALSGAIKLYKPLQEPIPVLVGGDGENDKFGIFCGTCGLSWRAQTIKANTTVLEKISAVPKNLGVGVKGSKSMHNLRGRDSPLTKSSINLRALSNEMEKEYGKQADSVMVYFSGIQCTCGSVLDTSCLCFQIVEKAEEDKEEEKVIIKKEEPTFSTTMEDRAKGIGKATLTLDVKGKRVRHANPLMSNPV
jgi:hypothetical protein